ncbi:MAG: uncharacterized protein A8A55_1465 [Amphiamblys sp. WSBS2006]|nr:MAG: uncharacterized protein A8A55_3544 [Amphiamblys sp. WSBS2006]OIR57763.1 MAG: uncharacterized protein A8A55_1465 [Amphiamblys sp. WSBS2006]
MGRRNTDDAWENKLCCSFPASAASSSVLEHVTNEEDKTVAEHKHSLPGRRGEGEQPIESSSPVNVSLPTADHPWEILRKTEKNQKVSDLLERLHTARGYNGDVYSTTADKIREGKIFFE